MSSLLDAEGRIIAGMVLSERVKQIMRAKGWTQADVARAADVHPYTVTLWVNGTTKVMGIPAAKSLARRSGFSADWIATGEGNEKGSHMFAVVNGSKLPEIDLDLLRDSISGVESYLKDERLRAMPDKKASMIGLIYEHFLPTGKVDATAVRRILRLVR